MKKGSTLIESIVSLFIVLISVGLLNSIVICTKQSIKYRNEKNNVDNIGYAIENEIKYNLTFKEIENLLDTNKEVSFNYEEDTINKLTYMKLVSLDRGNKDKIVIKKVLDNNNEKLRVCSYNIKIYKNGEVILERDAIKSYWM